MSDPNASATKADLQDLKVEMISEFRTLRSEFRTELKEQLSALDQRWEGKADVREQRMRDEMREALHDTETKLLQAFYSYAEGNNKRLNQAEGNMGIFLNRLGTVEERLLQVEKRLNIPPAM